MIEGEWARLGRVVLVGCGNMGGAMLRRWIDAGLPSEMITVVDPGAPTVPAGVRVVPTLEVGQGVDTLVLAIKPQQLDAFAAGACARSRLAISILAGVELKTLTERIEAETWVRAMPNLPVAIGRGVTALYADEFADTHGKQQVEQLMTPLGLVEWIDDEALLDAVTALSGCGPGFVFRFADALAGAGAALGLGEAQARRLAIATVAGAAAMAAASDETPAVLADRVASPGGSTREGLNVLDRDEALVRLMTATLEASARRNTAMAAAARQ